MWAVLVVFAVLWVDSARAATALSGSVSAAFPLDAAITSSEYDVAAPLTSAGTFRVTLETLAPAPVWIVPDTGRPSFNANDSVIDAIDAGDLAVSDLVVAVSEAPLTDCVSGGSEDLTFCAQVYLITVDFSSTSVFDTFCTSASAATVGLSGLYVFDVQFDCRDFPTGDTTSTCPLDAVPGSTVGSITLGLDFTQLCPLAAPQLVAAVASTAAFYDSDTDFGDDHLKHAFLPGQEAHLRVDVASPDFPTTLVTLVSVDVISVVYGVTTRVIDDGAVTAAGVAANVQHSPGADNAATSALFHITSVVVDVDGSTANPFYVPDAHGVGAFEVVVGVEIEFNDGFSRRRRLTVSPSSSGLLTHTVNSPVLIGKGAEHAMDAL